MWEIAARGEFYSAYTPYQAEASQGTIIYEYQTMMAPLTAPIEELCKGLKAKNILASYLINNHYPELGESLLVCATETCTEADIAAYVQATKEFLSSKQLATSAAA